MARFWTLLDNNDPTKVLDCFYGQQEPVQWEPGTWVEAESFPWVCDPYREFVAQRPGRCESCGELRWLDPHHLSPPEPHKTGRGTGSKAWDQFCVGFCIDVYKPEPRQGCHPGKPMQTWTEASPLELQQLHNIHRDNLLDYMLEIGTPAPLWMAGADPSHLLGSTNLTNALACHIALNQSQVLQGSYNRQVDGSRCTRKPKGQGFRKRKAGQPSQLQSSNDWARPLRQVEQAQGKRCGRPGHNHRINGPAVRLANKGWGCVE